jgi:hypothetical protein
MVKYNICWQMTGDTFTDSMQRRKVSEQKGQ